MIHKYFVHKFGDRKKIFYFCKIERRGGARGFLFFNYFSLAMIDKELVKSIVEDSILGTPMFLVEVTIRPGNIINVEVDSDQNMGIDDCVSLNKKIESQLDRDVEDYELEVGSAGLTSPFKIPRQYQKNIGNEVEVLSKNSQKLIGILKSCDESSFVVTVTKMVKPEGAKKKIAVSEDFTFNYTDVKYTKYQISFK